jgi:hypothetical protein
MVHLVRAHLDAIKNFGRKNIHASINFVGNEFLRFFHKPINVGTVVSVDDDTVF